MSDQLAKQNKKTVNLVVNPTNSNDAIIDIQIDAGNSETINLSTIASGASAAGGATSGNTNGAIVVRDSQGNFSGSTITGTDFVDSGLTANRAIISDGTKKLASSSTTDTELGYVHGVTSSIQTQLNSKQTSGNYITDLTGDATATGPGSAALTLATVNTNTGNFGSSTSIPTVTVNSKGLITAASANAVVAPAGTLTGTTLASNVVTSSLTSVGTIASGTWNGTTIAIADGGTGQTTAANAINALLPAQTGHSGEFLTTNGSVASWAASTGGITQLTGDVTAGPGSGSQAATVASVGGSSASNVHTAELAANAATDLNTVSTIVKRDVSGNFTAGTITAALTGNASTATSLQTARNINGVSFNGTADITVTAAAGTLTGTTLNSGVTASSLTSVGTITSGTWNGTTIAVANGGTGLTSLTANNVILGNGSGNPTFVAPGTSGNVLTSNGTTWTSAAPAASSSAGFMGSIKWAATLGAYWTRQASSFGAFTANGTIPAPTVTNHAVDPGNNLPQIKFASMAAGTYRFVAYGTLYETGGNQVYHGYRFNDGTNTTTPTIITITSATGLPIGPIEGSITYGSTQTNVTISLEGYCPATDTLYVDITTFDFQIDVYYFPSVP